MREIFCVYISQGMVYGSGTEVNGWDGKNKVEGKEKGQLCSMTQAPKCPNERAPPPSPTPFTTAIKIKLYNANKWVFFRTDEKLITTSIFPPWTQPSNWIYNFQADEAFERAEC